MAGGRRPRPSLAGAAARGAAPRPLRRGARRPRGRRGARELRGCECILAPVHKAFPLARRGRGSPLERPMALDPKTIPATAAQYAARDPRDILGLAIREYGRDLAISFS